MRGRRAGLGAALGGLIAVAACSNEGPRGSGAVAPSDEARVTLDRARTTFPSAASALAGAPRGKGALAQVEIARSTREATVVREPSSGVGVAFQLRGARDVDAARAGETVVVRGALAGADAFHARRPDGVEDFVAFDARPADESIAYAVDVSRVAGLRLVGGQLELLDPGGAPRLRVAPPYVVDVHGERRDAVIEVAGCAVDRDPRPPWGRAVVPPGAPSCEVRVRWSGASYPLLVDPAWTTTGALSAPRWLHSVVTLADGRPFVIGGTAQPFNSSNDLVPLATTEIYDPSTGTWAAGPPLSTARELLSATVLVDGRVLVAGGRTMNASQAFVDDATSVFYDAKTAAWSDGPPLFVAMSSQTAVRLANGRVLLVSNTSQEFDPQTNAWSKTDGTTFDVKGAIVAASNATYNKAVFSGGLRAGFVGSIYESWSWVYDGGARTWTRSPTGMKASRAYHTAATLADGTVLVAGGKNGGTSNDGTSEIYDFATDTWTLSGPLTTARGSSTAILLANGFVLLAGDGTVTEVYDPLKKTWSAAGDMTDPRLDPPLTLLQTGGAMAVAGQGFNVSVLASTERFGVVTGAACKTDGQCLSGHCADGVCCATACDGACFACSTAAKLRGADGVCEAVTSGNDPHAACAAAGPATCGVSGLGCDGAGQCAIYTAGTTCRPAACVSGVATVSRCDGSGTCASKGTSCGVYVCGADACKTTCDADTDCVPGYVCDTTHACVTTNRCSSDHQQQNPDGTVTDCTPYRCLGAACVIQCASVDDCSAGYVCDANDHCVLPNGNGARASDSGCSAGPAAPREGSPWLSSSVAVVVAWAFRRRRRR
jgi:hypothetical protein